MTKEKQDLKGRYEQGLLRSKLEVEEQTRKMIAQELHDNLGAISSLIKINLGLLAIETHQQKSSILLEESRELIKNLTIEIKQLSVSMNTDRLAELTLSQMLQLDVGRLRRMELFKINLETSGDEVSLPPDWQIILYRICQELLNNCIKHAKASVVSLSIQYLEDAIEIKIHDNGVGFAAQVKEAPGKINGSGLTNMISRAKLLNGRLTIQSFPGQGSNITLYVPAQTK